MSTTGIEPTIAIRRAFPEISHAEAVEMVALGEVHTYPSETILCHEGEIEAVFYVVLEGQVKVSKLINAEQERFLCYMAPGDFFGEMALIHNAPRAAKVISTQAVTVLEIKKVAFDNLVQHNSTVSMAMVREVSRRLRENNDLAVEDLRMKAGELASAYQKLAEVEFARSEFLTVVSHELRTPLTVANGFLQIIRSQKLQGDSLISALDTVGKNLQEIISLVNDILFLQEQEIILPEFEPTDIGRVVSTVIERMRSHAEIHKVGISLNLPPRMPKIPADGKSMERALSAILDNAIKFSPNGGDIDVNVGFSETQVWASIADQGVGIPPEHLSKIFDRFFHLEEVGGHLFRGVGLGLSIARQAIVQNRGKIEVTSEIGKGSTFTVRLNRG
jgi:signal transduction histidine kinase